MAKAGNNIYKRKDGRYEGRVLLGKTLHQKPQYVYVYAKTLHEVKQKMGEIREQEERRSSAAQITLQDGLEEWMEAMKKSWKPTTYDTYLRLADRYILPLLGRCKICDITKPVLDEFAAELAKRSGKKQLSEGYKKYICSMVCQVIAYAGEAHQMELPSPKLPDFRMTKREKSLPDEKDLERLEAYLVEHQDDETCLGILLAQNTGIRIGELCALQWKDIDLDRGVVMIRRNLQRIRVYGEEKKEGDRKTKKTRICMQMPKTMNSVRMIPLADGLVEVLGRHVKDPERYLVPGKKKEWAEVRTLQYRFAAILKKCQIPPFHFHMLRHAFASNCVGQGCDIKSLSEVLGHSNVQITMNTYVHSSMKQKKQMMNLVCGLGTAQGDGEKRTEEKEKEPPQKEPPQV